jgi:hypothetical protein
MSSTRRAAHLNHFTNRARRPWGPSRRAPRRPLSCAACRAAAAEG